MPRNINLAVGLPAYKSTLAVGHARMWLQFGAAVATWPNVALKSYIEMDMCGIDRARNFLVAHAMSQGAEWLLMVDSDTWVDEGSKLLKMIAEADRVGGAIVGAPVMRRTQDGQLKLNAFRRNGEGEGYEAVPIESMKLSARNPVLVNVDAIGAAVMAIDLRRIGDAEFRFTGKLSEDLDFCQQIQNRGGVIYCDPTITTRHVKHDVMVYQV